MAAIFLGLFVFAFGSTGISNAFTLNKNYGWNKRLDPYRYNNFDFKHYHDDEFGAPDYSDYGCSNGLTPYNNYGRNDRLNPYLKHNPWHKNYDFKHHRDQFERFGYGRLRCKNGICSRPGFQVDEDLEFNGIKHLKIVKPYTKKYESDGEVPYLKVNSNENMNIVNSEASFKATINPQDNMIGVSTATTGLLKSASSAIGDSKIRRIIKYPERYIERSSTDKSGNPTQPKANSESDSLSTSSEAVNFHVTDKKIPSSKISAPSSKATTPTRIILNSDISLKKRGNPSKPDNESPSSMEKENFVENTLSTLIFKHSRKYDAMESSMEEKKVKDSSEFITNAILKSDQAGNSFVYIEKDKMIEDQSKSSNQIFEKSHTENTVQSSTERKNVTNISEFSADAFTKSERVENSSINRTDESRNDSMMLNPTTPEIEGYNSTKNLLPNEEIFEKESTVFPSENVTPEVPTSFDGKSNSEVDTHAINNQDSKLESTVSENPPFSTTNEDVSLKIKSSSSEGINTRNIQNFDTKSTTSQSSVAFKSDATASQSSSSFGVKSTSSETLTFESTTESFISSSEKSPLFLFTDKVAKDSIDKISSAESPFPKTQIKPDVIIEKDHVIEIPSIRTARVVITSIFLVVALIASAVLAVYIFQLRRKEFQYDQVMLIP